MTNALQSTSRARRDPAHAATAPARPTAHAAPRIPTLAAPRDEFERAAPSRERADREPIAPPREVGVRRGPPRLPSRRAQQLSTIRQALTATAKFARFGYDEWGQAAFDPERATPPLSLGCFARLSTAEVTRTVELAIADAGLVDADEVAAAGAALLVGLRRGLGNCFFIDAHLSARGDLEELIAAVDQNDDRRLTAAWQQVLGDLGQTQSATLRRELGLEGSADHPAALRAVLRRGRPHLTARLEALSAGRDAGWLREQIPGAVAHLAATLDVELTQSQPSLVDRMHLVAWLATGGLTINPLIVAQLERLAGNPTSVRPTSFVAEAVAGRLDQAWLWRQVHNLVSTVATTGISAGAGDGLVPGDLADLLVGNGPGLLGDAIAELAP